MFRTLIFSTLVLVSMGQWHSNKPSSPIRIATYNDPIEFGLKINSGTTERRPKRNVTHSPEVQGPFRFAATTQRASFPSQGVLGGGAPPGNILPPSPPVLPPSVPNPGIVVGVPLPGPPGTPTTPLPPSPPVAPVVGPTRPDPTATQITGIQCMNIRSTQSYSAVLSLPRGFEAIPVFEEKPTIDPTRNPSCRMIPTPQPGMFRLILSDLETCGVKECRQDNGENWLCLVLRFPTLTGLKLPEDEIVEIRCRPQDRTVDDIDIIAIATANNNARLPSVFESPEQQFQCEIGLFAQLKGTNLFTNTLITEEDEIELGEEVQLKSIVKSGDGWNYSMLKDIIVQKMGGERERSTLNTAVLVFADGCRNPEYKVIARNHPQRDQTPLINSFVFRIFMFQDMLPGESLMISAKVMGCVDEEDCKPTLCSDDRQNGYGRRKRQATHEYTMTQIIPASELPPYPPPHGRSQRSTSQTSPESHVARKESKSTDWERNIGIKIKVPEAVVRHESLVEVMEAKECRLYLFITMGMAFLFCFSSIIFVIATFMRNRSNKNPPRPSSRSFSPQTTITSSPSITSSSSLGSTSESESSLPNYPVPPTVRKRKRDVHQELLNVFDNNGSHPLGAHYPGMMNYYGYMVVPRKPDVKEGKKSLRAIKREQKRHHHDNEIQPDCSCKPEGKSSDVKPNSDSSRNLTSVIHINSTGSNVVLSQRQLPMPKLVSDSDDSIYSEIVQDTLPTMV